MVGNGGDYKRATTGRAGRGRWIGAATATVLVALSLPIGPAGLQVGAAAGPSVDPSLPARLLGGELLVFQFDRPQDYDAQGNVIDESPFGARGTGPLVGEGRFGDGLSGRSAVSFTSPNGVPLVVGGDFSVSTWVHRRSDSDRPWAHYLLRIEQAGGVKMELQIGENMGGDLGTGYAFWYRDPAGTVRGELVSGLQPRWSWMHLAIVVEGNKIRSYIDGNSFGGPRTFHGLDATPVTSTTLHPAQGVSDPPELDEVRIYNRALSQVEVHSIRDYPYQANSVPEARIQVANPTECLGPSTPVQLDGSGSTDPDGNPLTYAWSAPGVIFDSPSSPQTWGRFPLGTTPVTLEVGDGVDTSPDHEDVVVIDTRPPSTSVESRTGTPGLGGWWRSPVQVGLAAVDICSDPPETWVSIDGAAEQQTTSYQLTVDGHHTVAFASTDASGNREPPQWDNVSIDATPPVPRIQLEGLAGNLGWFRSSVTVAIACDDALSQGSASTIQYSLNDGPGTSYAGPFVLTDGRQAVTATCSDYAGNVGSETEQVKIDSIAPALNITSNKVSLPVDDPVYAAWEVADATSGVEELVVLGQAMLPGGGTPTTVCSRYNLGQTAQGTCAWTPKVTEPAASALDAPGYYCHGGSAKDEAGNTTELAPPEPGDPSWLGSDRCTLKT